MVKRDERGLWMKGSSGNPVGRLPRATEDRYMSAMIGQVSIKDWIAIVAKAVDDAIDGKPSARKWLSDYLLGQPMQRSVSAQISVDLSGAPDQRRLARLRAILLAAVVDGDAESLDDGQSGPDLADGVIDGTLVDSELE